MTLGPDIVIACPYCRKKLRLQTLMSGNTIGMVRWSDGYVNLPMLPPSIDATCCVHCRGFFWVDTAQEVGKVWDDDLDEAAEKELETIAPYALPLTLEQLEAVVKQRRFRGEEEELATRYQWRWRVNHEFRESGKEVELVPGMEENLRRIAEIYIQRKAAIDLALAEVVWHLGEFDQALKLLDEIESPDSQALVSTLREAIQTRELRIVELT